MEEIAESPASSGTGSESASAPAVAEPAASQADAGGDKSGTDNAGEKDSPVDWDDLSKSDDGEEAAPVVAPAAKPAAEAKPAVATPAEPAKPAVAAEPAATSEAKPAPVAAKTPEQIETERVAVETAAKAEDERLFTGLVEYYKLPEDMQLKLSTEPENVLPFMAARLHQTMAKALQAMIRTEMPQYIRHVTSVDAMETQAETAFNTRWPLLKDKKAAVMEVGMMFRKVNPNATAQEAIERIGKTVMDALGLQEAPAAAAGGTGAPAGTPAAKPIFQPAGASGSRGASAPDTNEFSQMAQEFLDSDRG